MWEYYHEELKAKAYVKRSLVEKSPWRETFFYTKSDSQNSLHSEKIIL